MRNIIERAIILADGERVEAADLPAEVIGAPEPGGPMLAPMAEMDYREAMEWARDRALRQYLDLLLRRHEGNVTQAARQAGVERESLHRLLRQVGLDAAVYRVG